MLDRETPPAAGTAQQASPQLVDRERAQTFSRALRTLLQRQGYYVPLTGTYLLPQLYDRVRSVDGHGIHINTLRAYLRGESLPSDSKVRILADALSVPRGVLLYCSGYLTPEDLPNYPGPYATLAHLEADIQEVESLPLSDETKQRILRDLRTSARILRLLAAEQAQPDEREHIIELLIELWETPAPPPPALATSAEPAPAAQATPAPQPQPAPVAQRQVVPSGPAGV